MPLIDSICKNAKPKLKAYKINDGEGLWLFINPNGKKYWRCKYRHHNKENMLSFGAYPDVSLREAREKREKLKADLKGGNNPSILRQEAQQLALYNNAQTFETLAREWHSRYINNWSPKQAKRILRRLENELFGELGQYPIRELTRKVFLACIQKAAERSPELGKRLHGYCKQIFEYAGLTDRLDKDLTLGVKAALPKYIVEHFACIELEDLAPFIKALYTSPPDKSKLANQATRLALLFACRTMELLNAERKEFNLDESVWVINSDRMKKSAEQRKIKRDHLVPLSRQAKKILLELDALFGSERKYLLPSPLKKNKPVCHLTILRELDRIGYKSVMTTHGFRTLFMGVSTEILNFRTRIVDRQLAHVPRGEVMRTYDRAKYLSDRIRLMQNYADQLDKQIESKPTERKPNEQPATTLASYNANITATIKYQPLNLA